MGLGGGSVTLSFRPEVNGQVLVDTVDQPWPDSMGDPQKDPMIFGAWSMGNSALLPFQVGFNGLRNNAGPGNRGKR